MTQQQQWAKDIRVFAHEHYDEDGWDYVIECWTDDDIIDAFSGATTYAEAVKFVRECVQVLDSRRKDAEGEAF